MTRIVLLTTFFLAGCASSALPHDPAGTEVVLAETLDEVNRVLDGEEALVTYIGGGSERAFVTVGPEVTAVRPISRRDNARLPMRQVATAEVASVQIGDGPREPLRAAKGARVGLIPGGVLLAGGAVTAVTCSGWGCLGVYFLGAGGVVAGIVGGGVGGVIGGLRSKPGGPQIVYRGPVDRYLEASAHETNILR